MFLSCLICCKKKIKVRFSSKKFTINNKIFNAGSLIITRTGNQKNKEFDSIVHVAAKKYERSILQTTTGFVDSGNDFGSSEVRYLKAPKIALLSGKGVSSLSHGAIWHFLEQQIHYPISVIGTDYFNRIDFHDYDVIILPNGNYSKILNKMNLPELKK